MRINYLAVPIVEVKHRVVFSCVKRITDSEARQTQIKLCVTYSTHYKTYKQAVINLINNERARYFCKSSYKGYILTSQSTEIILDCEGFEMNEIMKKMINFGIVGIMVFSGLFALVSLTDDAKADETIENAVAFYHMDENIGTEIHDAAGTDNVGTLGSSSSNRPAWTTGYNDFGLDFDGINDYIRIPDSGSTELDAITFTLEAWINTESVTQTQIIICKRANGDKYSNYRLYLKYTDGQLKPGVIFGTGFTYQYVLSTEGISANEWYHLAGTYDGSSIKIYVNGELKNSLSASGNPYQSNADVFIGSYSQHDNPTGICFKGKIDEVGIYSRALSASEIAYNYDQDYAKLHFSFDNVDFDTGSPYYFNVEDTSGNAFHGKLNGDCDYSDDSISGNAIKFGEIGDSVLINHNLEISGHSFTVEMWIKPNGDSTRNIQCLIDDGYYSSGHRHRLIMYGPDYGTYSGKLLAQFNGNYFSTLTVNFDEWNHIAYVYDWDLNQEVFYINGEKDTLHGGSRTYNKLNQNSIYLGRLAPPDDLYFLDAKMDDVTISEIALSEEQIILNSFRIAEMEELSVDQNLIELETGHSSGSFTTQEYLLPDGLMWACIRFEGADLDCVDIEVLDENDNIIWYQTNIYTLCELSYVDPRIYNNIRFKLYLSNDEGFLPQIEGIFVDLMYSIDPKITFNENTFDIDINPRSVFFEESDITSFVNVLYDTGYEKQIFCRFEDPIGSVETNILISYTFDSYQIQVLDLKHNDDPLQSLSTNSYNIQYNLDQGALLGYSYGYSQDTTTTYIEIDSEDEKTYIDFDDGFFTFGGEFQKCFNTGLIPTYWQNYLEDKWMDDLGNYPPIIFLGKPTEDIDKDSVTNFIEFLFGTQKVAYEDPKWSFDSEREGSKQGYTVNRNANGVPDSGWSDRNGNGKQDAGDYEYVGDGWSDYKEIFLSITLPDIINKRSLLMIGGGGTKDNNDPGIWNTMNHFFETFVSGTGEAYPFCDPKGTGGMQVNDIQNQEGIGTVILYADGNLPGDQNDGDENGNDNNDWNSAIPGGLGGEGDNMYSDKISNNVPDGSNGLPDYQPKWDSQKNEFTSPIKSVQSTEIDSNGQCLINNALQSFANNLGEHDYLWITIMAHGTHAGFSVWGDKTYPYGSVSQPIGMQYYYDQFNEKTKIITLNGACYSQNILKFGNPAVNRYFLTSSNTTQESFVCDGITIEKEQCNGNPYPFSEPGERTTSGNKYAPYDEMEFFYHYIYAFDNLGATQNSGRVAGLIQTTSNDDISGYNGVRGFGYQRKDLGRRDKSGTKVINYYDASLAEIFNYVSAMESHHSMYGHYPDEDWENMNLSTICLEDDGVIDANDDGTFDDWFSVDFDDYEEYIFIELDDSELTVNDDGFRSRVVFL